MAILSDSSSIFTQILPSIRKGYQLPRHIILGKKLPSTGIIETTDNRISQEWIDTMLDTFQNGSLADFYDKYLNHVLTEKDHEKILLRAHEILKNTQPINPLDTIDLAAADIVHNAYEYGHHLFQTACFLDEYNQLPKECQIVLRKKINPALYESNDLFETVEQALSKPMQKISQELLKKSCIRWVLENNAYPYMSQIKHMTSLEFPLAEYGHTFIKNAVSDYQKQCRLKEHQLRRHQRPIRRTWRGHDQ
ncbi:MAG: hypothetical protein J6T55_00495 [Alphaproteobacteria bacterium]|nr:hypothetical protein [Alphaproteobacteria bacterium]